MRVAIIGSAGIMGSRHAATAIEYGASIVMPDDADVVVIASPDQTHAGYAIYHLERGQAVFCEKPLATNLTDLAHIQALSRYAPIGCHLPLRQKAGQFEIKGDFSAVYDYGRKTKFLNSWRNAPDYDLVMGGGIHMMDLVMREIMGNVRVKEGHRAIISKGAKCPDKFLGRFEIDGVCGTLIVDFTKDGVHRHIVQSDAGEWINEDPLDKTAQLKAFLDKPVTDELALSSHRACLSWK